MIDGEAIFVVALVLQLVLIVTFFVMAANVSRIRRMLETSVYPSGPQEVVRMCPHCKERIHPEAAVCPHCQRELEPWVRHEGRWWKRDDAGEDVYFDTSTWEWVRPPRPTEAGEVAPPR